MNDMVEQLPKSQNTRLEEENELLLQQLHQVQEELEHYFLLNQANEKKLSLNNQSVANSAVITVAPVIAVPKTTIISQFTDLLGLTIKGRVNALRASGFFDEDWYLRQYPDVAKTGDDPVEHYLRYGAAEGRNPSALFDTRWYLQKNPDVAKAGVNPLLHYVKFGKTERRLPCHGAKPGVDISAYGQAMEELSRLAVSRASEIDRLNRDLQRIRDEHSRQLSERGKQLEAQARVKAELEGKNSALTGRLSAIQTELAGLQRARVEQEKLMLERQNQIELLLKERDAQARMIAERQGQIEQLVKARDEQVRLCSDRQGQIEQLKQLQVVLERGKTELAAKQEALAKEVAALVVSRDAQAKLASDRLAQLEQFKQTQVAQEQAKAALEREKSVLAEKLADAQNRLQQQEGDVLETNHRQLRMNDELVRAEAQIDLIKEVLLRDPGL